MRQISQQKKRAKLNSVKRSGKGGSSHKSKSFKGILGIKEKFGNNHKGSMFDRKSSLIGKKVDSNQVLSALKGISGKKKRGKKKKEKMFDLGVDLELVLNETPERKNDRAFEHLSMFDDIRKSIKKVKEFEDRNESGFIECLEIKQELDKLF
jgi:hypothetical protein